MNINAQAYQRSCRTRMTMNAVKVFKDKEKFFIPFSFDYRGRCYPIPAFLTPQDTDFGKSLLCFYEAAEITPSAKDWLAFQCATTYGNGMDKATIDERHAWPDKNRDTIIRVATDPIRTYPTGNLLMNHGASLLHVRSTTIVSLSVIVQVHHYLLL